MKKMNKAALRKFDWRTKEGKYQRALQLMAALRAQAIQFHQQLLLEIDRAREYLR